MPGFYNLFFIVKKDMSFSCSNIKQLIVNSSSWTVGGKPGLMDQTVGAAASHHQGAGLVLKIQQRIMQIAGIDIHNDPSC